jgi:hypothetical protein
VLGAGLVYRAIGAGSAGPPGLSRALGVTIHPENALLSIGSRGRPLPLVTLRF